jgi:hypothetical protein
MLWLLLQALASLLQEQAGKDVTPQALPHTTSQHLLPLMLIVLLLLQALASLLQEQAGKDVMVSAGGVPLLVHGLEHPDADVTAYCSEMLARLAGSSAAQTAIRCEQWVCQSVWSAW